MGHAETRHQPLITNITVLTDSSERGAAESAQDPSFITPECVYDVDTNRARSRMPVCARMCRVSCYFTAILFIRYHIKSSGYVYVHNWLKWG